MKKFIFDISPKRPICFMIVLLYILINVSAAQNPVFPLPANWDTTRIYAQAAGTLQKIAIGNHLKGTSDDTFRLATGQSPDGQRNALILTDTSSMLPMKLRVDIPFIGAGTNGIVSVAIGDVDADGMNEIIFGQAGGNLKRVKWVSNSWNVVQIDSQSGIVYDIAIGDADNNGFNDIIFSRYNYVFRTYWNGSSWQTNQIWSGDASTCHGVAIGDFDSSYSGNEIVTVTSSAKVVRIRWTGSSWDNYIMLNSTGNFYDPAIGNFDTLNPGNEIVFGNASITLTYGSVIELYGSGNNWATRIIYHPSVSEACQNIAIGDVLDEHPGNEVVGILSGTSITIRVIYGSGANWSSQPIVTLPQLGECLGIAIGDVNKYRSHNQEIVFARSTTLFEAEQRLPPGPTISNVSHYPVIPLFNETVTVKAKILDTLTITADSLYYSLNLPINWQPVTHFNVDSFYYYNIPVQDTGTLVHYFIKAKNNSGETQSPVRSYRVAYEHSIYQIQHIAGPSDTSPDNIKYVHTKGIVTGVFGRYFNIEEEPGGAWHGVHIRRPNFTDTLPCLAVGDSITVLGRVVEYLNQTVMNVFYDSGGRTERFSTGRPLPCTTIAKISQIAESLEGTLVRLDTVRYKNTGYFQSNTAYRVYNFAENESLVSFIRSETNIPNESIPPGYLFLTGNLNQYVDNYQIVPRAMNDLNRLEVDFGAIEILFPPDTVNYGDSIIPKVIIRNYLVTPVINLSVWLQIGNTYNNEHFFPKLGAQSIDTVEFAAWFAGSGQHRITAYTRLSNDLNPNNDTVFDSVYVNPPAQAPDIGVTSIIFPKDTVGANDSLFPKVEIRNFTSIPAVNFHTIFKIGSMYLDSTFVPNLGASQADTIQFKPWLSVAGNYSLLAYTKNILDPNPANDTAYGTLSVQAYAGFWSERENMPPGAGKRVKQGGALVYCGPNRIFALKGNNTCEFFAYDVSTDSWIKKESIPVLSTSPKRVKRGGALTFDPWNDKIYALKGSNTREFWEYAVTEDSWAYLGEVPSANGKRVKGGAGLAMVNQGANHYVYFMKGTKTNEFYAYDLSGDTWLKGLKPIPLLPSGKPMKDGSSMTLGGDFIYCLKGSYNDFYAYEIASDSWHTRKSLPLYGISRKKKKVKDGAGLCFDERHDLVYAIKGGNTQEFWAYYPDLDTWTELETIPRGLSNKRVKSGGSLTFADDFVFALKGNNTRELWRYTPGTGFGKGATIFNVQATNRVGLSGIFEVKVKNPTKDYIQVKFNTNRNAQLAFKIYNISGALVKYGTTDLLHKEILVIDTKELPAGVYILRLNSDKTSITRKVVIEK